MDRGVTLRTERLTLRPPAPADAGWIAREIARPQVHEWLTAPPRPFALSDAQGWIAANRDSAGVFVIEAEGDPLGVVSLDPSGSGGELGYWLKPGAWGCGVMSEAATAALGWHFGQSQADVPSGHILGNAASRAVLLKLGFRDTAREWRHSGYYAGEVELQRMVLTKEAWEARHG